MTLGRRPFAADNHFALLLKHKPEPVPDPRELVYWVPPALCGTVQKATAKKPDDRYQSCEEMASALEAALSPAAIADQCHEDMEGVESARKRGEGTRDYVRSASSDQLSAWRQGSDAGMTDDQHLLACHLSFQGDDDADEVKHEEAYKLFRAAAEQGHVPSMCSVGVCYDSGEGVAEDKAAAARWLRKAIEQGYARAQAVLGACYNKGDGVAKDAGEARKWYQKAAAHGDEDARKALDALGETT